MQSSHTLFGAIAHGYATAFYITEDEVMFHGGSMFCEVLVRLIEKVAAVCDKNKWPFPEHLVVQADNTVNQAKNDEVNRFLSVLVGRFRFRTATINFLIVGHTHEDIDLLFAILLSRVLRKFTFRTPAELVKLIHQHMKTTSMDRGEELHVEWVKHIRDFHSWMNSCGVTLYNCWRPRHDDNRPTPHSFAYKLRQDLTASEQALLRRAGREPFAPSAHDVFGIVKGRMNHTVPNGPPVLSLPVSRRDKLPKAGPTGTAYKRHPMTDERRMHLLDLACVLEKMSLQWAEEYSYSPAVAELRALANGRDEERAPRGWLEATSNAPQQAIATTGNPYFSHLPQPSWQMLSAFRRSPG